AWYVVLNETGVTGFIGSSELGKKPSPLLPDEVDQLLKHMSMSEDKVTMNFEMKENVKVTDGPFSDFMGTIEHIDDDKEKLKVHVNMFSRETPVELDFTQVEKV